MCDECGRNVEAPNRIIVGQGQERVWCDDCVRLMGLIPRRKHSGHLLTAQSDCASGPCPTCGETDCVCDEVIGIHG